MFSVEKTVPVLRSFRVKTKYTDEGGNDIFESYKVEFEFKESGSKEWVLKASAGNFTGLNNCDLREILRLSNELNKIPDKGFTIQKSFVWNLECKGCCRKVSLKLHELNNIDFKISPFECVDCACTEFKNLDKVD